MTRPILQLAIDVFGLDPEDKKAPCPLRKEALRSARLNNFDFLAFALNVFKTETEDKFLLNEASINFENNVSPKLNNVSPKLDSHRATDPLLTELQEIIFDLYDEKNFKYARRLEDFEISFLKYLENTH